MRLFKNLLTFYFKQLTKSYLYISLNLFMIVMLAARIFLHSNEEFDYFTHGDFVGEMMLIVQAVMLLIIVFFYRFLSDEFNSGTNSLSGDSSFLMFAKLSALLFIHLTYMLFFITIQIGLIFLYFFASDIPISSFYNQTILFIVVYWFFPFILSFFIGALIALLFGKNKISFVFIIFIWLLIGPMNTTIFSSFFIHINSTDFKNLFYIGPFNIFQPYIEFIGYNMTPSSFLKVIFWIVISLILITLTFFKLVRTRLQRGILFLSCISLLLVNTYIYTSIFQESQPTFHYAEKVKEIEYYKGNNYFIPLEQLQYDIQQYDIQLTSNEQITAKVDITLENVKSTNISFVLYHSYPVQKVTDSQGNQLPFIQKGDTVTINKDFNQSNGSLSFFYKIQDSFMIPISENYLYLPNYFSWIPTKAYHQPFALVNNFDENGFIALSMQNDKLIDYTLTYKGDLSIYTNLIKNKDGIYRGSVTGGITITGGQVSTQTINGEEIIYPNSWPDISNDWPIYKNVISKVHKKTIEIFHLPNVKLPNKYFLLNPTGEYNSFLSNDHLVIQHGTLLNIGSAINEVPDLYVSALLWNSNKRRVINYEQVQIFNSIASHFIKNELKLESYSLISHWDGLNTVPETFSKKFDALTKEQQEHFLFLWYSEMHKLSSWSDTENLFKHI